MPIIDEEIILQLKVINSLLSEEQTLEAVFDTGFDGFLLLPPELFDQMRFRDLYNESRDAITAVGEHVSLVCTYGTVEYPELGYSVDGVVCTSPVIDEVLIGMQAISGLELTVNICNGSTTLRLC